MDVIKQSVLSHFKLTPEAPLWKVKLNLKYLNGEFKTTWIVKMGRKMQILDKQLPKSPINKHHLMAQAEITSSFSALKIQYLAK